MLSEPVPIGFPSIDGFVVKVAQVLARIVSGTGLSSNGRGLLISSFRHVADYTLDQETTKPIP